MIIAENTILGYALWGVLIGIVLVFIIAQIVTKKKLKGKDLTVDSQWLEKSLAKYPADDTVKRYYMEPDKNFIAQGHVVVDRNHRVIYEEKLFGATATAPYEVDYVNHIIDYKHHHQMTHTTSFAAGVGMGSADVTIPTSSYYKFDGENIWSYIKNKGYDFHVGMAGLGYTIQVTHNGNVIGMLYSSDQGRNYFDATDEIKPKLGMAGCYIIECRDRDIDGMILVAIAFSRTEFSMDKLK